MKRILLLLAILALSFSAFSCGGGGAASSNTPAGENPGIPSVMQMSASHNIAQTNASITLHAKVLDGNGAPIADVPVTFTNLSEPFGVLKSVLRLLGISKPIGVLSASVARTDGNGIARVSISSTTPGFATVQAEVNTGVGIVRDKKTVFFSSFALVLPTPPPPTLSLHVDDGNGIFDQPDDFILFKSENDNQRTIRADVLDSAGNKVVNSTVTFGADSTEATFPDGNVKTTDSNGQAFVRLVVTPASIRNLQTVINITATADNGAAGMVTLFLRPVVVAGPPQSYLTANPPIINVNGTSTITAVVKLNTGAPVADNTAVNFTVVQPNCGFVVPFGQTVGGVATATYSGPPTPKTCTIAGKVGSVSIGTVDVLITTSLTVQPGTLTVNGVSGGTATFTIFGGSPSYTVTPSNAGAAFVPSPATVTTSGGTFTVTIPANTPAASVTYTIRDSAGAVVTATLTIGGGASLSVQPGTQTINGVTGGTATYTIFGGNAPYTVASSNPLYPPVPPGVSNSGDTFAVTVPASSPGASVVLTVRDSTGSTATATLTISAGPGLAVLPATQTISGVSGGTLTFTISGGLPGYTVTSTNPAIAFNGTAGNGIWNVPSSGGTFVVTVPAGTAAASVTLGVLDSAGATVSATVTITAGASLSVQPGTQSINGGTGGTATFTVFGGLPGYTVTSSNPAIAFNGVAGVGTWNVTASGGTFVVTVPAGTAAGSVVLTVRDTAGTTVAATLSITAPGSLRVTPSIASVVSSGSSQTLTFTISGGTGGYVTTSSDPSKAFNTAPGDGVWSGTPVVVTFPANVAAGSVTLNVFDSAGSTTTATITIIGPSPVALQISPKLVSVLSSASITPVTFTISGGTPGATGYVTTSNDSSKAFNTTAGNGIWNGPSVTVNFAANAAAGSVTLNVLDSVGGTTTATITIIGGPAPGALRISPQVVTLVSSGVVQGLTFTISGGTPGSSGYVTTSSDPSKAFNVTVGNGIWNGTPVVVFFPANVAAGSVTLTVLDSVGGTTSASITIIRGTAPLSVSPASVSVTGLSSPADDINFSITGGSGTYLVTALSSNTAVVPNATVVGSAFTIHPNPVFASTAVTMTVIDSLGETDTSTVTVTPTSPSLGINPSSITVDAAATSITFTILGGVQPYTVYTSDIACFPLLTNPLPVAGPPPVTFTNTGALGTACPATITVVDSDSKTVTATVTIP